MFFLQRGYIVKIKLKTRKRNSTLTFTKLCYFPSRISNMFNTSPVTHFEKKKKKTQ